jgi:hypothetical protein
VSFSSPSTLSCSHHRCRGLDNNDVIRVGDRIRIDVELIELLKAMPHSQSQIAVVDSIMHTDADGGLLIMALKNE